MTSNINTIDYYWNKFPTLEINNIEFNSDKDLLIFSTNSGYRIYDNKTFQAFSAGKGTTDPNKGEDRNSKLEYYLQMGSMLVTS